jgi:hypothetical protein
MTLFAHLGRRFGIIRCPLCGTRQRCWGVVEDRVMRQPIWVCQACAEILERVRRKAAKEAPNAH